MIRRTIAVAVTGAGTALALTGCLGGGDDKVASPPSSPSPVPSTAPAAAVPAGWKVLGGAENGLRIAIPKGWKDIELTSGDLEAGLRELNLQGPTQDQVKQGLETLKERKAVYAVEAKSAAQGYATTMNALCAPSPGGSISALKSGTKAALGQLGAQDIQVVDATVGGRPGVKTTYSLKSGVGTLVGQQYMTASGDKSCTVTITAKQGKMPADSDEIAGTFQIL